MDLVVVRTRQVPTIWLGLAVVAAAIALPAVFHSLPPLDDVSWGARVLAIFFAPMVALPFFGLGAAVGVGATLPAAYFIATGNPPAAIIPALSLELVAFAVLLRWLGRMSPVGVVAPALSYLGAKIISALLLALVSGTGGDSWLVVEAARVSMLRAIPGMLLLCVMHEVLCRSLPPRQS